MLITRLDPISHKENTKDLPITQAQLNDWKSGALVQDVFPNLSADDREFILTGITPESWAKMFGS